jgi:hypothetical protein
MHLKSICLQYHTASGRAQWSLNGSLDKAGQIAIVHSAWKGRVIQYFLRMKSCGIAFLFSARSRENQNQNKKSNKKKAQLNLQFC